MVEGTNVPSGPTVARNRSAMAVSYSSILEAQQSSYSHALIGST